MKSTSSIRVKTSKLRQMSPAKIEKEKGIFALGVTLIRLNGKL